ncbi:hypothetical protein Ciccas_000647 [Cichlidogyrus casuarinus]|uniref:Uncharacterized protein n=1 Tax=Cichlidogyrus casuarinus TaxID=1844966 RepID=A0ABD2QML1_9PLAT
MPVVSVSNALKQLNLNRRRTNQVNGSTEVTPRSSMSDLSAPKCNGDTKLMTVKEVSVSKKKRRKGKQK